MVRVHLPLAYVAPQAPYLSPSLDFVGGTVGRWTFSTVLGFGLLLSKDQERNSIGLLSSINFFKIIFKIIFGRVQFHWIIENHFQNLIEMDIAERTYANSTLSSSENSFSKRL